jgi:hypothetical protein
VPDAFLIGRYTLDATPSALRFPRGQAIGLEKLNELGLTTLR